MREKNIENERKMKKHIELCTNESIQNEETLSIFFLLNEKFSRRENRTKARISTYHPNKNTLIGSNSTWKIKHMRMRKFHANGAFFRLIYRIVIVVLVFSYFLNALQRIFRIFSFQLHIRTFIVTFNIFLCPCSNINRHFFPAKIKTEIEFLSL